MRWWIINAVFWLAALGAGASPAADSLRADSVPRRLSFYERRTLHLRSVWDRMVPNMGSIHFYGSVGLVSLGTGWHYGRKDQWETELLLGFVPKYESDHTKVTLTLKERFVPWRVSLSSRWAVEPLTAGLFLNTIFGEDFWARQPSRYPKDYYGFAPKLRANVFIGQRLRYNIPSRNRIFWKSISAYYELSTCDLYLVSAIPNRRVRLSDILSLAFGLRLEIF